MLCRNIGGGKRELVRPSDNNKKKGGQSLGGKKKNEKKKEIYIRTYLISYRRKCARVGNVYVGAPSFLEDLHSIVTKVYDDDVALR